VKAVDWLQMTVELVNVWLSTKGPNRTLGGPLETPSIWRNQLVSGFHLGKIWATILRSPASLNERRMASHAALGPPRTGFTLTF